MKRAFAGAIAVVLVAALALWRYSPPRVPNGAAFVGSAQCGSCHTAEFQAWRASQHAAAMQVATPGTVLGDFRDASITVQGVTSSFFRQGDRFMVRTDGPDGALHDYAVRFTFGVYPLQQYLIEFPGGRLQPLTLAWDARPRQDGGARWFSLDEEPQAGRIDELHWTGRGLNWNYMCADCHSTAVRKGYDAAADSFHTTSAEVRVGCEACHGPGDAHSTWARKPKLLRLLWPSPQLRATLHERLGVHWTVDTVSGIPRRSAPRTTDREIETCAQCHARRGHIADGYVAGESFFDHYDPLPLLPELYWPDGQQKDEVYDYGSFLQSRMFAFGVTCADCHDPHSQKLRRPGNAVCTQCHWAAKYDATSHHGHAPGSPGAACAACHMPTATYMGVDRRHDHSLRVPRPDRTIPLGVPNACQACHADRSAAWAVDHLPPTRVAAGGFQRFAEVFAMSDRDDAGAADSLARIVDDASEPAIVRASALARLAARPTAVAEGAAAIGARDPHPMVRRWAVDAARRAAAATRIAIVAPLLSDSTRMVRQAAAAVLASVADSMRSPADRAAFDRAAAEFVASQQYNADRAENRTALGVYYLERGHVDSAEAQFRVAVTQWPTFVDGYVNLAGVLSLQGREGDAAATLRQGIARVPDDPRVHHALGLSLARAGQLQQATTSLAEANRLSHSDPDYAYPYAVVLHGTGHVREAMQILEAARRTAPRNRDVLFALSTFARDMGDVRTAQRYAGELLDAFPDDAQAQALSKSLGSARK